VFLTILAVAVPGGHLAASDEISAAFESSIQPILKAKCGRCHNPQKQKGGLDLSTMATVRRGGDSGEPAVSEKPDESLLWLMIDGGDMPPEGEPRLTVKEKAFIRKWIEAGAPSNSTSADPVTQHDVLPYLYTRCVVCHGRTKQEGGLDLRSVESILKGGKSGPTVTPGRPHESLLLKRVHAKDMPPPRELIRAGVRPLEPNEIDLITRWVAQGAQEYDIQPDVQTTKPDPRVTDEDRQFWAFQSPRKPAVPHVDSDATVRNPVDAFLLTKLDQRGLGFSMEASRLTLVRRVAFDLTGLPPEWEDFQRFLADESDDWYTGLVDYYLASPHYGERWGRYWLDVCGYADSEGKRSADPIRPHAWRFRDYVVRSLNEDKSYDRFLLEQIAGDELFDFENAESVTQEMADALIATGFLRMAPDGTGSDIVDTVNERFEVVADEIDVLGSAVLGLTLRCAQCHTHKYDPIPQRDYYRLVAVFQGAYDVYDWLKPTSVPSQSEARNVERRYLKILPDAERQQWEMEKRRIQILIAATRRELKDWEAKLRLEVLEEQLAKIPEETRDPVRTLLQTPGDERTQVQKELAVRYEELLIISDGDLRKKYPELAKLRERTRKQVKELKAQLAGEPMIRALWDRGEPSPTWIFHRGEATNPGQIVGPGVLSVLSDGRTPFEPKPMRSGSTGRRLAFAKWLLDPKHPLTARVVVNRVWFHHFGRGIVESLANFGKTGARPSHPQLLDWLATSFVENSWSLKWLHREIMNSTAYRQTSQLTPRHGRLDPDNRWISRMPMRRLEAESVRDSLLAVAGQLNRVPFGEPDGVAVRDDGLVTSVRGERGWRRSVYVLQRRKEIPTILEAFDLPQMIPNCIERPNSTVATQALHLRNNEMVRELSREFARRIEQEVPDDRSRQVERIYNIALSRSPTSEEKELALQTLQSLTTEWAAVTHRRESEEDNSQNVPSSETRALANLCHVIMNSAEFLFLD
jgi:hypothetical protein